ncbi:uncharacterized protein LOC131944538 [Physella acuta]|uniref:uncharacterized protein LOC131944538 n=1 Tax=Physella acuta TaxID=109671 RepID=UPI0027DB03FD|nr:uncharacterized protein LOC131944538 [Physella acuta]
MTKCKKTGCKMTQCKMTKCNMTKCKITKCSWLVPLKASQQKVQGKIFSSGKFCNTTRNITVLSDGSISYTDFLFCTGQRDLCLGVDSSNSRQLVTLSSGLQVMCDTVTDGGGWTIFQRRVSGTVDFYRNWTEYKNGFGDFSSGNFYLGNENIYLLTYTNATELRVDMVFDGTNYFAKYSRFTISSEEDGYRLYVGGYTGNANNSLGYHNGMMFSTFDRKNDAWNYNCVAYSHGGWWFRACLYCFLNAVWGSWLVPLNTSDTNVQGEIWSTGKFCNTTRNITVLSDGSISENDFQFCTGNVMCDTVTDGGGWTIFQRRVSGTVDFFRNWTEYKIGFGDFSSGNFYLGNENIYLLTSNRLTELRVDMIFNGTKYFGKYSSFNISSEADGFRLHVGNFTGNAGDGLAYHNGRMFSTFDRNNGNAGGNCAADRRGAWWFGYCDNSHLNAGWGTRFVYWYSMYNESFSEMKFRSV